MSGEKLIIVLHPEPGAGVTSAVLDQLRERNHKLLHYKRISGYVVWDDDFPRTASLKVKRYLLAEQIRDRLDREQAIKEI